MPDATIQEIRQILKELSISQKETDAKFKETDARFKETDAKINEREAQFKEEERLSSQEVEISETDKYIQSVIDKFEPPWCRLVAALAEGELIRLLKKRGLELECTARRIKGKKKGIDYKFDITAHNDNEIVIVKVKTTLRPKHVKKFISQLNMIDQFLPIYKDYDVYGAIAFLDEADNAAIFAEKQKLFVIRATGDSAAIVNAEDFEPRVF